MKWGEVPSDQAPDRAASRAVAAHDYALHFRVFYVTVDAVD